MAGCAAGLRRSLGARSGGRVRGTMFIAVPLHQLQGSELTLIVQAAARPLRLEQPRERHASLGQWRGAPAPLTDSYSCCRLRQRVPKKFLTDEGKLHEYVRVMQAACNQVQHAREASGTEG